MHIPNAFMMSSQLARFLKFHSNPDSKHSRSLLDKQSGNGGRVLDLIFIIVFQSVVGGFLPVRTSEASVQKLYMSVYLLLCS